LSISSAQLAANRRNALRSSGPKSEGGKTASAQNAVTHGLGRFLEFDDHLLFPVFVGELVNAGIELQKARQIASSTLYCDLVHERKQIVMLQCSGPSDDYTPLDNIRRILAEMVPPDVKVTRGELNKVAKILYKAIEESSFGARHYLELANLHSKMLRYETNAYGRLAKSIAEK